MNKPELYQIQWREDFSVPPGFSTIQPSEGHQKYFEYPTIDSYISSNFSKDKAQYAGFFSPSFLKKSKMRINDVHNFLLDHREYDAILFNAFPHHAFLYRNSFSNFPMIHAKPAFEEFSNILVEISGINLSKSPRIKPRYWVYNNYIVASQKIWVEFREFYKPVIEKYMEWEKGKIVNTKYKSVDTAIPFIFERLFSIYAQEIGKINVKNYSSEIEVEKYIVNDYEALFLKFVDIFLDKNRIFEIAEEDVCFEEIANVMISTGDKVHLEELEDRFWLPKLTALNKRMCS